MPTSESAAASATHGFGATPPRTMLALRTVPFCSPPPSLSAPDGTMIRVMISPWVRMCFDVLVRLERPNPRERSDLDATLAEPDRVETRTTGECTTSPGDRLARHTRIGSSVILLLQRREHAGACKRQLAYPKAGRVEDGVRDCRRRRDDRWFSGALRPSQAIASVMHE
ncbi:MAG: hypothetical protein ACOC2Q_04180 [Spirochaetota bacterium]